MAFDRVGAFEVIDDGILFEGGAHVTSGPDAPTHSALSGDYYFRTNGEIWKYTTEWVILFSRSAQTTAAIQSNATQTWVNLTNLQFDVSPGRYLIVGHFIYQSTALATGIGLRLGAGTATIDRLLLKWFIALNAAGQSQSYQWDQLAFADNIFATSTPVANADQGAHCFGVVNVTVAGNLNFQFRSETTNAVSVRPGSTVTLERIA